MKIYVRNGSTHTNAFMQPHPAHPRTHTPAHPLGWHFWFAFLINFGLCMLQLRLSLAAAAPDPPSSHTPQILHLPQTQTQTQTLHICQLHMQHTLPSHFPLGQFVALSPLLCCCILLLQPSRPDQLFCIFISWNFKFIRCLMCLMVRPASDLLLLHL